MHDAGQSTSFVCLQLLVMRVGSDWIHPAIQFTRSHPPHEVATGGLVTTFSHSSLSLCPAPFLFFFLFGMRCC
ncbi:hypothetical protein V8C44DRAFT_340400 [Trichoderma aethiopicum]